MIKKSNETPVKKFQFPQTSAQEIGWNTEPLVSVLTEVILNFLIKGVTKECPATQLHYWKQSLCCRRNLFSVEIRISFASWVRLGDKETSESNYSGTVLYRDPRGGVLPYKGLMGTCGQPGYVFWDFCLKQGIDFIIFCLKQAIFSWTINSLRVCPTN